MTELRVSLLLWTSKQTRRNHSADNRVTKSGKLFWYLIVRENLPAHHSTEFWSPSANHSLQICQWRGMCNIIVVKQPKKYFFLLHFQVRDEYRTDFDPGRGGFGKQGQQSSGVISGPPVAYSKRWHMLCMQSSLTLKRKCVLSLASQLVKNTSDSKGQQ